MTTARRASCERCGAPLASDQEYCLDCGTRRTPPARSPWIAPLVAAVVVIMASAVLFMLNYLDLRDDANRDVAAPVAKQRPAKQGAKRGGDDQRRPTKGSNTD